MHNFLGRHLFVDIQSMITKSSFKITGFSLKIPVTGERHNITGAYFERGSTSE